MNKMAIWETEEVVAIDSLLYGLFGSDDLVINWWVSYNKAFGCTPEEMWFQDRERVKQYVLGFCI